MSGLRSSHVHTMQHKEDEAIEKERYHLTTRRNYNFKSGAFESDYATKDDQVKAMISVMEKHMPAGIEEKAVAANDMDEYIRNGREPAAAAD